MTSVPSLPSLPGTLLGYLDRSVAERPGHPAAEESSGQGVSYEELDRLAGRTAAWLARVGVRPGDRVAIHLAKSVDALAALLGAMKCGAAYVPVDAEAPMSRSAFIMSDCAVRAVVTESRLFHPLQEALASLGAAPAVLVLDAVGGGGGLGRALLAAGMPEESEHQPAHDLAPEDLAYILYTSGSTGQPKGVMLTHQNATAFVDWCSGEFKPRAEDRFSSHAPFHFDLSILDLFVPMRHGATIVLIGGAAGKEPAGLAALIAERRISVWYSTPSVLAMLAQYGKLDRSSYPDLRLVLFAGEVFPLKHLRALQACWPRPLYVNLYGPTETNVCTWHPVPDPIPAAQIEPFPIGRVCPHLRGRVVDPAGTPVTAGEPGELLIAGSHVMAGYWNQPERTASAFLTDPDGTRWYRTGDLVSEDDAGVLRYLGRRDRMVKRRGFRIELGDIEAGLYSHPEIAEVAVVSGTDATGGVRITAVLVPRGEAVPTTIELKRFCMATLPAYMVPDRFVIQPTLAKTSTDKTDYQALRELA